MTVAPGEIISDRYRIVDLLGEGGMGAVYRAEHVHMRKMVALKVLLSEVAKHPEVVARFEREAVAAGSISHPNVVTATDFGRLEDGSFFLVMEYVPGRSLRSELAKGPLEPLRALHVVRGILGAIEAAHAKSIVHRDLKPENVMLVEREGDPDFVKVLDFGIAKIDEIAAATTAEQKPGLTRMGTVMGTPEYMAPEQALGQAVDARCDLYSLGIIFYELLTGKPPFHGEAIVVMRKQVLEPAPPLPDDVAAALPGAWPIVQKLLEKEPQNRYATAKELRVALASIDGSAASSPMLPVAGRLSLASVPDVAATANTAPPATTLAGVSPSVSRKHLVIGGAALVGLAGIVAIASMIAGAGGASAATLGSASASALTEGTPPPAISASASPSEGASPSASAAAADDGDDEEDEPPQAAATATPRSNAGTASAPKKTTRTKKKTTQQPQQRKTGPGGIYIPPPNTWFD